jgi:LuxR family transcriptional regulator, maltose regulon positive regulatory protein
MVAGIAMTTSSPATVSTSQSSVMGPFEPTAGRAGSMLVNVPALIALHRSYLAQLRGDAENTAAFAQRVLTELGGGEQLVKSLAQWNLAVAEWLRGRPTQAARAFASSIAAWRTVGQRTLAAYGGYQLSQVQRAQGRLDAAARTCLQALEFAALPGRPAPPTAGPGPQDQDQAVALSQDPASSIR